MSLPIVKFPVDGNGIHLSPLDENAVANISLPFEIFENIFGHLYADVLCYPEYKTKILEKELTGCEAQYRLIHKNGCFVDEKEYSALVKQVYKIALCCK